MIAFVGLVILVVGWLIWTAIRGVKEDKAVAKAKREFEAFLAAHPEIGEEEAKIRLGRVIHRAKEKVWLS